MIQNYVQPSASKMIPCPREQRPCLTLKEYANKSEVYFVNNTVFYFYSGIHRVDSSLKLINVHNFSFQSLASATINNGVITGNVILDSQASISWEMSSKLMLK